MKIVNPVGSKIISYSLTYDILLMFIVFLKDKIGGNFLVAPHKIVAL
jgi:hypothetical protein